MVTAKHTPFIFILPLLITGFTLTACNTEQAVGNPVSPESIPANSATDVTDSQTDVVADTAVWEAATFYSSTCAACHGQQGEGSPIAPSLSSETAEREWVIETISTGRPDTAMVAWSVEYGGPLDSEQVAAMADFVQTEGWQRHDGWWK